MDHLTRLTASQAAKHVADGDVTPSQLLEACLTHIDAHEPEVRAWSYVDRDGARRAAAVLDTEAREGHLRGPLHGVPIGIKDVIHVAGLPTTGGAAEFAHEHPGEDATCVARLRAAGAIIVGKTTTTELAYFEPAETRNPWNTGHTPGGSSSGSAAAVSANMVPATLGSQTIGSVLRPAAFCGVIGFKGTHGAVPGDGILPLAALSLDHAGVLARSLEDVELIFGLMADRFAPAVEEPTPRIAIAPELLDRADTEVADRVRQAAERLADAGAKVTEVALPASFTQIHQAGQRVLEGEFAAFQQALFHDHADAYRQRTRGLIEAGLQQRTFDYVHAQVARARFRRDMLPLLHEVGTLLTPTAAGTAPEGLDFTGDPWFCAPWSSIGVPAVSLPHGLSENRMPHAVQLVGPTDGDAALLRLAGWCAQVLDPVPVAGVVAGSGT